MNEWLKGIAEFDWGRLGGPMGSALRIIGIAVAAWILVVVLQRMVRGVRVRIAARLDNADGARRAETLGRVIRYLIAMVIGALAVMLVLGELGVSLAPVLGAAGVVGLAVGFGAQSLVKDYFTGFFILFEDQIRTGDVVRIADLTGTVEDITLRHVRLRDYEGNVHFVPNGLITTVSNMGRVFAQSVIEVGIAYREDVDEALDLMREVGAQMRLDPVFGPRILEDLEVAGVERWDDSAVVLRCRFKVQALQQWGVRREFLRRLKSTFDARGIEIPYPHLTVYAGADKSGAAPPLPLRVVDGSGAFRPAGEIRAADPPPAPERQARSS
ncbi:MAG: mechanosensitive ion channel family protein [Piscinibacter sp.]|nr:mechanosensitive ion channel family protein [Piscinibacter sp.]